MTNKAPNPNDQSLVLGHWSFLGHWCLILGVFLAMLSWSWGTWPDPVIDFGRELYIPWRITQGEVLYHDIIGYFNGPFSPYLHALLFKIAGPSLLAIVLFNAVILLALVIMSHRLISEFAGMIAATVSCVAFLVLFAFAQVTPYGNYNFITPYSYELTHGITLTIAAILCLNRWHWNQRRGWLVGCGLLLGIVFLTKAEVFTAAAGGLGVGFAASLWLRRVRMREVLRDVGIFIGCVIVPVLLAFLLLRIHLSASQAIHGLAGAWSWINDRQLMDSPYFKRLAGTLDTGASIIVILKWTGIYAVIFGLPALIAMFMKNRRGLGWKVGIVFFVLWFGIGMRIWKQIPWQDFDRPLPLILLISATIAVIALLRRKSEKILPLVLIVWSLVMLAKIRLNVQIFHYGFALAMPGTILLVSVLIGWLPAMIDRAGRSGSVLRGAALGAVLVTLWAHAYRFQGFWSHKQVVVGMDNDEFLADSRGRIVNDAIRELTKAAPPGATLAVLPEGLMINYLTRRVNPTGHGQFTPPAMMMYGNETMTRQFQDHPPDFVMLAAIETSEYGPRIFGVDYAQDLWKWVRQNYTEVTVIGPRPFVEPGFGIVLMKKK